MTGPIVADCQNEQNRRQRGKWPIMNSNDINGLPDAPQTNAQNTPWWPAYGIALFGVIICGAYTLFEPFGRDQGIHASIAYGWDQGLTPYRDIYNIKPPMTTLMHWLSQAIFGPDMQAIRLLDVIVTAIAAIGLVQVMRDFGRSRAESAGAGIGLSVIYYSMTYWEHAQTDGWAGFLVIAMVLCMSAGWRRKGAARLGWMLGAGVVLGLGVGFKYTVAAAALVVFAPLIATLFSGVATPRFRLSDLIAGILGGCLAVAAILAVLWFGGALEAFLEIQDFIRGYVAIGAARAPNYQREIIAIIGSAPVNIAVVGLGLLLWLAALMRGEMMFVTVVLIWGLTGFVSGHVQGQGFTYHFLPLMPVYAILWGLAFGGFWDALSRRNLGLVPRIALILVALLVILPRTPIVGRSLQTAKLMQTDMPAPDKTRAIYALHPTTPDFDSVATSHFADQVAERRSPGDSVFVWGYETALYLLLQEPPRHRYPYAWPFVVRFHDGRYTDDLMTRLTENPPRHIIVQDGDATPLVTGREESSAGFLNQFPALTHFIDEAYDPVDSTARFTLWERR